MATITTTDIAEITLGDYLLSFDDSNDDDGTAGTYDEREYDDLEKRVLARIDATLPTGWRADVETDYDGTYVCARNEDTGKTTTDATRIT